jgi:hypothetical protein
MMTQKISGKRDRVFDIPDVNFLHAAGMVMMNYCFANWSS